MKRIASIALFFAATFISVGSVMAQDHVAKATVTFPFTVSGSSLPAGNYTIGSDSNSANMVTISDRNKSVHILAIGLVNSGDPGNARRLVFHKYGAKYFLSEVRYADSSMNVRFPVSTMEKRARSRAEEASLPAGKEVMIALK